MEKSFAKAMLRKASCENPIDIINEDENKLWGSGYLCEYWYLCN